MSVQQLKDSWLPLNAAANSLFKRDVTRKVYAVLHQEYTEGHRDKAAELATLVEGVRDSHTPQTEKAELEQETSSAARDAGWRAALSVAADTDRARKAAAATEAIAGGDVSRYTDWLLSSPVATGTAIFAFGDVRPNGEASLILNFSTSKHQIWETQSGHHHYE